MKARNFYIILMGLFFFFSCNEEERMINNDDSSLQFEQAKLAIHAMGLDTAFISEWDNYYVVEGDILICKDSLNCPKASTRQYRTTYYASNLQTITIGVNNTISQNTNWREAVRAVVKIYNEYTGLTFVYSEVNPTITISKGYNPDLQACANGTFPTSPGRPGSAIIINTNFFSNIDTYLTLEQKIFLLMHELGHNLGLRHTNGIIEGDAGFGLIQIPGTPTMDPNSFMNANTCGHSWNNTVSEYDKIAFKYLWPCCRVYFAGSRPEIKVAPNSYLSRSIIPTSTVGFCGWYKDAALTIPWNYTESITSDISLYPKSISGSSIVKIEDTSDTSYKNTFTLSRTAAVTLTVKVGRGLNEWWEISQYANQTGATLRQTYQVYKQVFMEQYIWNANPETYIERTEEPIVLDPGTYDLTALFTTNLGLQYGASGKHGVTIATLTYQ